MLRAVLLIAISAIFVVTVVQPSPSLAVDAASEDQETEAWLTGKSRPSQVPADWIGSATKSAPGWRWDDPKNPGNSVRIFRGNPNDPDPTKRRPYVVVVRNGQVIGRNGAPIPTAIAAE
jgi:hypothetical protein